MIKIISIIAKIVDNTILKIPQFQDYVNTRCNQKMGLIFVRHSICHESIEQIFDYNFSDIQKDDIVLDIGATGGEFSLFISKFVKKVYAVEPVFTDILRENIKLNNITNITVFDDALGDSIVDVGCIIGYNVGWLGKRRRVITKSLTELKNQCGGHIDFLKCDCEGGEKFIKTNEIKDIRRIEVEVHQDYPKFLKMLSDAGFTYDYKVTKDTMIVHARNECLL